MSITTIIRVSIVLVIQITEFENILNNPKLKFTDSKICDITPAPTNNISSEYYRKSNKNRS